MSDAPAVHLRVNLDNFVVPGVYQLTSTLPEMIVTWALSYESRLRGSRDVSAARFERYGFGADKSRRP